MNGHTQKLNLYEYIFAFFLGMLTMYFALPLLMENHYRKKGQEEKAKEAKAIAWLGFLSPYLFLFNFFAFAGGEIPLPPIEHRSPYENIKIPQIKEFDLDKMPKFNVDDIDWGEKPQFN